MHLFTRAVRALVFLAPLSLVACAHTFPDRYFASDGHESGSDPHVALRESARYDLQCDDASIRDYEMLLGTTPHGRYGLTRNTVQVAEGCGKRAIYKPMCDQEIPIDPKLSAEEAQRKREWTLDDGQRQLVCKYVLLSRVTLDPHAPATDSVAFQPTSE